MTSHDVVAKARRKLSVKQIGHAGTLDPMATGVMVLAVGKATRLLRFLPGDKTYRATFLLGESRDTDDIEGQITEQKPLPSGLDESALEKHLEQFRGHIEQLPPLYSAIHINGKRLYEMARSGEMSYDEVKEHVKTRPVTIHKLTLDALRLPFLELTIHCSSGTYIRSIARDLAASLGTAGCMSALRRITSGLFQINDCLPLAQFESSDKEQINLLNPAAYLPMPDCHLENEDVERIVKGQAVKIKAEGFARGLLKDQEEQYISLKRQSNDELIAIARLSGEGQTLELKPEVVLLGQS